MEKEIFDWNIKLGWFVILNGEVSILNVLEINESDDRYMICDIVSCLFFILKCNLKVWKIFVL